MNNPGTVTVSRLRQMGACEESVAAVASLFGTGPIPITAENLRSARRENVPTWWLAHHAPEPFHSAFAGPKTRLIEAYADSYQTLIRHYRERRAIALDAEIDALIAARAADTQVLDEAYFWAESMLIEHTFQGVTL